MGRCYSDVEVQDEDEHGQRASAEAHEHELGDVFDQVDGVANRTERVAAGVSARGHDVTRFCDDGRVEWSRSDPI